MRKALHPHVHGFSLYFKLRFQFFLLKSQDVLARYWMWFLLAGFCVPGLPIVSIFLSPSQLFAESLSSSHNFLWHIAILLVFEIGSILWLLPQKYFLYGGSFRQFSETLPISLVTKFGVSATLALIVDTLLFIPVLIGIYLASLTSPLTLILNTSKALTFIAIIIFMQTGFIENLAFIIIGALLSNIPFAASCISKNNVFILFMIILSVAVLLIFFSFEICRKKIHPGTKIIKAYLYLDKILENTQKIPLTTRIQVNILMERPIISNFCYFATIGISFGIYALIKAFDYDERSLIVVIIGMAINALIVNKIYHILNEAHYNARILVAPLPISKQFWLTRDIYLILSLSILPLSVIFSPILLHKLISFPISISLVFSYFVLLISLRLTVTINARFRFLTSIMLVSIWAASAIMGIA